MQARFLGFAWVFILGITFVYQSQAQSLEKLHELKGYNFNVYISEGAEVKANRMATQISDVMAFYDNSIHFRPSIKLLVLSPQDWTTYTTDGMIYGMPHYTNSQTLVVAAENNAFWKSFIPPLDKMPEEEARIVSQTYTDNNGELNMEPFFDLLALHELGHAYHIQDSLKTQRLWMGELFSNILLHTYVEERAPQYLPALTVFPKMVVATTDRSTLKYTTLNELQKNYNLIGQKYPRNYGWYQCRWHIAAATIYSTGKLESFKKLWFFLKKQRTLLDDQALATSLKEQVHPAVADVMLKWDSGN